MSDAPAGQDSQQVESINFDGISARVFRSASPDLYVALEPPEARPFVVANNDEKPDDIVSFVTERLGLIREMRADMAKHFSKTKSLECRYQTGDVAYVLGRPFMLRVFPTSSGRKLRHAARGRANTTASVHTDVSLVDLFVIQTGNYDQRRLAFTSWASGIFAQNAQSIVDQAAGMAGIVDALPGPVRVRPMRSKLFRLDGARRTVWASDDLIPYPAVCVGYAFMSAMARELVPAAPEGASQQERDAVRAEREALVAKGCPGWQRARLIMEAEDSPYKRQ
ncbi:MAG: hypothetical protein LKE37_02735 [Atopobiaceae bacterium]|jgi:hypothetical protein|nr:hypothetical protein [Atopobiaceae bacterium]